MNDLVGVPPELLSTPTKIIFPHTRRGRFSPAAQAVYQQQIQAFAKAIKAIDRTIDFKVSSRGWCYLLESHGLTKAEFDKAQGLINDCRKSGLLPLGICAEDSSRSWYGVEMLDYADPTDEVRWRWESIQTWINHYQPISFWENQPCYVQMYVEKIDLRSLFEPICQRYHIPIANARGWSDLNLRGALMERFKQHEQAGRRPVLLYCGDFDPAGLRISDGILNNLRELKTATGWNPENLVIDRFGLNREFIDDHRLTWIDNLITGSGGDLADSKHPDHSKAYVQDYIKAHGVRKVEANALVVAAKAGRALCEKTILQYVNSDRIKEFDSCLELTRKALAKAFSASVANHVKAPS